MNYIYIFLGGGLGSIARYVTSQLSLKMFTTNFPMGTFMSNVIACAILAILVVGTSGKELQGNWVQPLFVIGFCGGYSTFSTFSNETFELVESGHHLWAILNVILSVAVGVGLIFLIRSKLS